MISTTLPVAASEMPGGTASEESLIRSTGRTLKLENTTQTRPLWIWSEGRRAFAIDADLRTLRSYDLDTLALADSTTLPAPVLDSKSYGSDTDGPARFAGAVDGSSGRLYLAYYRPLHSVNGSTPAVRPDGQTCTNVDATCLNGILAIDASTLEVLADIPASQLSADGGHIAPMLRAMQFAPPREPGDSPKLLLLTEESAGTPVSSGSQAQPRWNGGNVVYLLQLDVESATRDWIMRVEGCRGARENSLHEQGNVSAPAAVMRSLDAERPAVIVGCHQPGQTATVVRVPLDRQGRPKTAPVTVGDPVAAGPQAVSQPDGSASGDLAEVEDDRTRAYVGPEKAMRIVADPVGQRMLIQTTETVGQAWWVFDARRLQYVGTIGIGPYRNQSVATNESTAGVDVSNGRLYVVGGKANHDAHYPGGLWAADFRRVPVPQALLFPELAVNFPKGSVAVDPGDPASGRPTRLYVQKATGQFLEYSDSLPVQLNPPVDESYAGRTLDLEESAGRTLATYDAAGRGYGSRILFVGGFEATGRIGPVDPGGATAAVEYVTNLNRQLARETPSAQCSQATRELVLGIIGPGDPAAMDAGGTRAHAEAALVNAGTKTDLDNSVSRCLPHDWEDIFARALVSHPPTDEPSAPWLFGDGRASCLSSNEEVSGTAGDATARGFAAHVECAPQRLAAWARASAVALDDLSIAESVTSMRIYLDPERGAVSRVESAARGIALGGLVRIDSVLGSAESWANGRMQPVRAEDRGTGYVPNCDFERTAGTCFRRNVFGVRSPVYSCGPCGDEQALVEGLDRALGSYGQVRFRQPDKDLARGAENGFIAAVQKQNGERFADMSLNNDLMQTTLPSLEVIRYATGNRPSSAVLGAPIRGRQIYQFAGVEVSSTYGIQCLLVYDAERNTCGEAAGSIRVMLSNPDGQPLAGGAFELREDADADGVLGLADRLLPGGTCVTADDGIGTCVFENLQPGSYLVSQVAAPPGYAQLAEPWVTVVASGEQRTVAVTNVSNVSTIELTVTDDAGAPLSGATFAAYPDPDADGEVEPDADPAATCTTDGQGACSMQVPAGSYVLVQTGAAGGLEPIEPVAFTFANGGQVAAVAVVNSPSQSSGAAPAVSPQPTYSPPVTASPPVESVASGYQPTVAGSPPAPEVSLHEQIGGTVVQVVRAPGDALRLLAREPRQALAWTAALAVFLLAAMAVRRRQTALALMGMNPES